MMRSVVGADGLRLLRLWIADEREVLGEVGRIGCAQRHRMGNGRDGRTESPSEREELRHRAAQKAAMSGDQWWLSYQNKGGGKQREKAKWQARLKRFLQIAQSSTADGERENAQRLAEQAQAKLDSLEEQQDDDE